MKSRGAERRWRELQLSNFIMVAVVSSQGNDQLKLRHVRGFFSWFLCFVVSIFPNDQQIRSLERIYSGIGKYFGIESYTEFSSFKIVYFLNDKIVKQVYTFLINSRPIQWITLISLLLIKLRMLHCISCNDTCLKFYFVILL